MELALMAFGLNNRKQEAWKKNFGNRFWKIVSLDVIAAYIYVGKIYEKLMKYIGKINKNLLERLTVFFKKFLSR